MKKLLCLLLAALMIIGMFAGCSGKGDSSSESQKEESSSEESEESQEESSSEAEAESPQEEGEMTEITWYFPTNTHRQLSDYNDMLWMQELKKITNVSVTFQGPASGDDYATAVNILLASDELPDLLFNNWNNYNGGLEAAVADGVVIDFSANEDYKALVPNWFDYIESHPNVYAAVTFENGNSAMFNTVQEMSGPRTNMGYVIRKDWLDQLNMEVPTTVDELYEALTAFKENDMNGNGDPDDEIPLVEGDVLYQLMTAWGLRRDWNATLMYKALDTGKITYWTEYQDGEPFKDFMKTMRKWYEEGIIDPEFVSQDTETVETKITSDRAGLFFAYPSYVTRFHQALDTFTGRDDIDLYGMTPVVGTVGEQPGTDGKSHSYNDGAFNEASTQEGNCLTRSAEDHGVVEPILKMINYMYSEEGTALINWGVEGVSYTVDSDGNKVWTDEMYNDPELAMGDKVYSYAVPAEGRWPKIADYQAWRSIAIQSEEAGRALDNFGQADNALCMPVLTLSEAEATEYNPIMTDVGTAVGEAYNNYILGNIDDAGLDTMLNNIEDMGIARAIEIYQGVYDRYTAKLSNLE